MNMPSTKITTILGVTLALSLCAATADAQNRGAAARGRAAAEDRPLGPIDPTLFTTPTEPPALDKRRLEALLSLN